MKSWQVAFGLLIVIMIVAGCATQELPAPDSVQDDRADLLNESADAGIVPLMPSLNGTSGPEFKDEVATPEDLVPKPQSAARTLSITERYEQDFLALNRSYYYLIDIPGFGETWVIHLLDKTKYTNPDHLFEVHDGMVSPSQYRWSMYEESFIQDIRERRIPVMNYITYENGSYYGCYVRASYFKRENCITDNTSRKLPIIHENITFAAPQTPVDWLRKYHGQEPIEVRYNYTSKEDNLVRVVDLVYFANPDGTLTRLTVQQKYHVPLQVDTIKDKKVISTVTFKYLTTDMATIKQWNPWFFES